MVVRYGLTNDKEVYASLKRFELNNVDIGGGIKCGKKEFA